LVDAIVNVKTPGLAVKEKCDARGIAPDSDNISNVISGQAIDRNAANELSEFLGKSPQHWLDIQKAYDRKLEAIVTQAMAPH
jgi:plasmid maintenance system antidote protein VapI